ncbi:MAG: hypothetical protein ACOH5I_07765 [Oligoflexus sp.]
MVHLPMFAAEWGGENSNNLTERWLPLRIMPRFAAIFLFEILG